MPITLVEEAYNKAAQDKVNRLVKACESLNRDDRSVEFFATKKDLH